MDKLVGTLNFGRDIFVETMDAIEAQFAHDEKCSEAFKTILPNDHISFYDNDRIKNQLIELTKIAMNDDHDDSWIEYFIYELGFGKGYYKGCVTHNKSNIDISSAGKLYDFLNEN